MAPRTTHFLRGFVAATCALGIVLGPVHGAPCAAGQSCGSAAATGANSTTVANPNPQNQDNLSGLSVSNPGSHDTGTGTSAGKVHHGGLKLNKVGDVSAPDLNSWGSNSGQNTGAQTIGSATGGAGGGKKPIDPNTNPATSPATGKDGVLVNFDQGDPHNPYVLGTLSNGKDNPPTNKVTKTTSTFPGAPDPTKPKKP